MARHPDGAPCSRKHSPDTTYHRDAPADSRRVDHHIPEEARRGSLHVKPKDFSPSTVEAQERQDTAGKQPPPRYCA